MLAVTLCHYVDDFIGLEAPPTVSSGFAEFTRVAAVLGMKMKEVKAQSPSSTQKVLGVNMEITENEVGCRKPGNPFRKP